jgi:hypothetical protein
MLITTVLTFFVIRYAWKLPLWLCIAATGCLLRGRLHLLRVQPAEAADGGWFPLMIGGGLHADDDLEARPRDPEREAAHRCDRPAQLPRRCS